MKKYYFHFICAVLVIFTVGCEKEILEELTTVDQGRATQLPHQSEQLQMVPYGNFTAPVKELALRLKVKGIPKKGTKTTAGDSIITDYARIFYNENDQTTSYTFLKHKEDTAHGDLENLVVVTAGDSIQKAYTIHYSAGSVTNGFPYVPSIDDTSITAWPYDIELLENIFNRDCSLDVVTVFIYVFCMNGGDTNSCGSPGEHTGGTYVTSTVSTCDAIQDATGGGGSSGGGFLSGGGSNNGGGIVGGSSPVLPDHVKFEIFKGNLPRGAQEYLDSELVLNTEIYHLMQLHRFSIEIQSRVEPILSQLGDLGSDLPYAGMGGLLEATEESVLKVLGFVTAMPLLSLEEAVVLSNIEMLTGEPLMENEIVAILENPAFAALVIKQLSENPAMDFEVDFEEFFIETPTPDSEYVYQGETSFISNPLILENGAEINITFGTTKSDNENANKEVALDLIDGIKFAIQLANENLDSSQQITSIHIHCTTNGQHSATSNHSRATAVDISRINNTKMIVTGVTDQITELQNAMDQFEWVRENFGPHFKHKYSIETGEWNLNHPIGGHKDHIHFAIRK